MDDDSKWQQLEVPVQKTIFVGQKLELESEGPVIQEISACVTGLVWDTAVFACSRTVGNGFPPAGSRW